MSTPLSHQQQADVLHDFMMWNGGLYPEECLPQQIDSYVASARDKRLDADAVEQFLSNHERIIEG